MTPLLHPFLVNDPFGDPALYVDIKFEKRALLFDLGDLHALDPRKFLRLTDVFVSHAHIDHFIGFDQLLRTLVGRDKRIRLYGPAGIIDRVEHKLAGYTWNLAHRYKSDLIISVTEMSTPAEATTAAFQLRNAFRREAGVQRRLAEGVLLDDETLCVRAAVLEHIIPCLGFAVEEKAHVNVWKNRLETLGLPVGPWLRELKRAVVQGEPDDSKVRVWWREGEQVRERYLPLGTLKKQVLRVVPGQKISYVVDSLYSEENAKRIVALAWASDILFIEAAFSRADTEKAADRYHLTTHQAGTLARLAGVRRLEPFHFSPRYAGEEDRLRHEVAEAFAATITEQFHKRRSEDCRR